jgi:endonuclease-3 related protein
VGAILTQNTSWSNVERAIVELKTAGALAPVPLYRLPNPELERLIRSSGTFRVKARRLRAFLKVLVENFSGHLPDLFRGTTSTVRQRLLGIPGIGPETADCMLLYASTHERFVVDAYTQRIFVRHAWTASGTTYAELQTHCETGFVPNDAVTRLELWRDAHAQLVMVGKSFCRSRAANCTDCPLRPLLPEELPLPT